MTRPKPDPRRRGLTVVEGVVALSLFTVAMGMGSMMLAGAEGAYRQASNVIRETADLRRQSDRLAETLATVSTSTMYPVPTGNWGSTYLFFQQVEGIQGDTVSWSPRHLIFLAYDVGELNDGLDNDGDGLIDECRVMLVRNVDSNDYTMVTLFDDVSEHAPGEKPNGWDDNGNGVVDEYGLNFHLEGDVMTIRTCTAAWREGEGLVEHELSRTFRLMN